MLPGRVISLTNENGSHSVFSYDALDRLVQQGGFDGRTQRYHYDLTGKLTQSEDEGLVTLGTTMRRTASRTGR